MPFHWRRHPPQRSQVGPRMQKCHILKDLETVRHAGGKTAEGQDPPAATRASRKHARRKGFPSLWERCCEQVCRWLWPLGGLLFGGELCQALLGSDPWRQRRTNWLRTSVDCLAAVQGPTRPAAAQNLDAWRKGAAAYVFAHHPCPSPLAPQVTFLFLLRSSFVLRSAPLSWLPRGCLLRRRALTMSAALGSLFLA